MISVPKKCYYAIIISTNYQQGSTLQNIFSYIQNAVASITKKKHHCSNYCKIPGDKWSQFCIFTIDTEEKNNIYLNELNKTITRHLWDRTKLTFSIVRYEFNPTFTIEGENET